MRELAPKPVKPTAMPTERIFANSAPAADAPKRKRVSENMTADWLQKRFHYLEDRILSIGHSGEDMSKAIRQYENHIAKMRELAVPVPKSQL